MNSSKITLYHGILGMGFGTRIGSRSGESLRLEKDLKLKKSYSKKYFVRDFDNG